MYISAVLLKTNLRVLYIAALISMVRSSLLKRPSSCRSSSSLSPTNSQCRSSLIERQIIDHQLRPEYLGKAGLVIFKELTKGMKRIRAIERKYPTSRGFIAMIQRKRLLKFCTWTMRERRKKRAAAAAASDRLTADEAMIEAGLEAVAPDELHIIDENPAAPCGSAGSPAPSTAPSVMSISSEEEESRELFERMHNLTEQWKRESNREPGDEQGSSKRLQGKVPIFCIECGKRHSEQPAPGELKCAACKELENSAAAAIAASAPPVAMDSSFDELHFHDPMCDTAPAPSFLSDKKRRRSRVERGPHKAKELQQPKAPAVHAPPAAPREPADYADAPCGSCIEQLLR